jgi:hypothetical protein
VLSLSIKFPFFPALEKSSQSIAQCTSMTPVPLTLADPQERPGSQTAYTPSMYKDPNHIHANETIRFPVLPENASYRSTDCHKLNE